MKIEDAAKELKRRHEQAETDEKVASIHLFAIEHADAIRDMPKSQLADLAGIGRSFGTELSKGVKLAKYVQLKVFR